MPIHGLPTIERVRRMRVTCLVLVLVTGVAGAAEGQDAQRFTRWLWQDAAALSAHALPLAPVFLAGGGMIIPAGEHFDQEIRQHVQRGYEGTWGDYLDVANDFGGRHMWIPATSLFAMSLAVGGERFQDAAFTSMESVFASVVITAAAKQVIGRARPEDGEGSIRLRPFSGNVSFPSGHTTVAFAIVTPWVYYYPGPLSYSLFALSVSTGLARIAKDKHWPTDVLAGATVGFLTGRWLSKRHQGESSGPIDGVRPMLGLNTVGVSIRLR
jgi:membrane-associated phospholipid phosphatase